MQQQQRRPPVGLGRRRERHAAPAHGPSRAPTRLDCTPARRPAHSPASASARVARMVGAVWEENRLQQQQGARRRRRGGWGEMAGRVGGCAIECGLPPVRWVGGCAGHGAGGAASSMLCGRGWAGHAPSVPRVPQGEGQRLEVRRYTSVRGRRPGAPARAHTFVFTPPHGNQQPWRVPAGALPRSWGCCCWQVSGWARGPRIPLAPFSHALQHTPSPPPSSPAGAAHAEVAGSADK